MEKTINELQEYIQSHLPHLKPIQLVYAISDICLNKYEYHPVIFDNRIKEHRWTCANSPMLSVKHIRLFLSKDVTDMLNNLQAIYLAQSQLLLNSQSTDVTKQYDQLQQKIKKLTEIILQIDDHTIFHLLVDSYRDGYII